MANYHPLSNARAVVGAPVFYRLPNGVGVITAILGLEPRNLAHAQANGRPISMVPLVLEVRWADGSVEQELSCSLGDYDHYLLDEERIHGERLARRAALNTPLPINRP